MISVEDREAIRRAYFVEEKSIRQIARTLRCSRKTVRKAIASAEPPEYTQLTPRPSPVLDPYRARIDELMEASEQLPRKQRYTAKRIYDVIVQEGYTGSAVTVRRYVGRQRARRRLPDVFLPLAYDPGRDAQVDWGEAICTIAGVQTVVQLFVMRLCYSRRLFMMAFPAQKQEAFFEGHRRAFRTFGGVPHRIVYDNLKTAVLKILTGRRRQEQLAFVHFRSHYLFESRFCTPGAGHEKGGVENGVGYGRRNFLVPPPEVSSFEELNELLLAACDADTARQVEGEEITIREAFAHEQPLLRLLPERDYDCAATRPVVLSAYSQIAFESNRYSVPVDARRRNLVVKAYPFHVEILTAEAVIARHRRSYGTGEDIIDPLHYLPLLEERPGAFEHAKPIRQWRKTWPALYDEMLARLLAQWPGGRGVREFVQILALHREYRHDVVLSAVEAALSYGAAHADGVRLCLRQLLEPERPIAPLCPGADALWARAGTQPVNLSGYNQLLAEASHDDRQPAA